LSLAPRRACVERAAGQYLLRAVALQCIEGLRYSASCHSIVRCCARSMVIANGMLRPSAIVGSAHR
jgi:hypothetical protein